MLRKKYIKKRLRKRGKKKRLSQDREEGMEEMIIKKLLCIPDTYPNLLHAVFYSIHMLTLRKYGVFNFIDKETKLQKPA